MNLSREVFRLAVPSILANITVPLVGMVDIAIAGHLGSAAAASAASAAFSLGLENSDFLGSGESRSMGGRVYSKKWKSLAEENFRDSVRRMYEFFENSELKEKMPDFSEITLKFRKLKSMWGSCNRRTDTITLNYELLRFPQICIDYVALHELAHFLCIYHDKKFYAVLARFMPDYKAVIKMMK